MHFCVSAARGGLYGQGCCPRKIGTNWFMPAFVKSRFGESGIKLDDGTMVCCFDLKKSRKDWRISELVIGLIVKSLAARLAVFCRVSQFPLGRSRRKERKK